MTLGAIRYLYATVQILMTESYTVFQQAEQRIDSGAQPKEYPIYRDLVHGVTASITPFSRRPLGVVVYPHEVQSGNLPDHLSEGPLERTLRMQTVAHAVGRKILHVARLQHPEVDPATIRARQQVDGREVPDHAHIVIAADSPAFELAPGGRLPEAELGQRHRALNFTTVEARRVFLALDTIKAMFR